VRSARLGRRADRRSGTARRPKPGSHRVTPTRLGRLRRHPSDGLPAKRGRHRRRAGLARRDDMKMGRDRDTGAGGQSVIGCRPLAHSSATRHWPAHPGNPDANRTKFGGKLPSRPRHRHSSATWTFSARSHPERVGSPPRGRRTGEQRGRHALGVFRGNRGIRRGSRAPRIDWP